MELYGLAVVGAGLAALSALRAGLTDTDEPVVVLDYQEQPGGFLRPALPARGFEQAWDVIGRPRLPRGARALFGATAVGLLPASTPAAPHALLVRRREGTTQLRARRVLIACGGLEQTREHAQVPGTRPSGVITPALAHQLLSRGYLPGRRCLVYGASRYAAATAGRLAAGGAGVVLVPPLGARTPEVGPGVRVEPAAELARVGGFPRLVSVRLRRDGRIDEVEVDTLIYATGMAANTHWLRGSGLDIAHDRAVVVDDRYQTNIPGIYAIGTVVAPCLDHASSMRMGGEVAAILAGGSA